MSPSHRTLSGWATAQLREMILTAQLPAGARLYEHELAARMGVSRTPVREAIRQLERENLVAISPNRETVVTDFTGRDVLEISQVRAALEGMAAGCVAERRDPATLAGIADVLRAMEQAIAGQDRPAYLDLDLRFHEVVLAGADNARLRDTVERMRSQTRRYLAFRIRLNTWQDLHQNMSEHRGIAAAIERGDRDAAEQLMREHIVSNGVLIAGLLDKTGIQAPPEGQ